MSPIQNGEKRGFMERVFMREGDRERERERERGKREREREKRERDVPAQLVLIEQRG